MARVIGLFSTFLVYLIGSSVEFTTTGENFRDDRSTFLLHPYSTLYPRSMAAPFPYISPFFDCGNWMQL